MTNSIRRRSGTLGLEQLEAKALLSANGGIAGAESSFHDTRSDRFDLRIPGGASPEQYSIALTNESAFQAEFRMRFNGNISSNLQDLVQHIQTADIPGTTGDEPDYERVYHYMLQFHQHDFPLTQRMWQHDPIVYINSLGFGLCDDAATAMSIIWREMGYESRIWLLDGHVVSEVNTGERWEMYDADLRVHFFNRDGQVAGVEELANNPGIIRAPTDPVSENPYLYSARMAQIYRTTENNRICTVCEEGLGRTDLTFQLPAGGRIEWGQSYSDKTLPTVHIDTATKFGQVKVTIPAGATGSVDIPLVMMDLQGTPGDAVTVGTRTIPLGTGDAFEFLSTDTVAGNRVQAIEFDNNQAPIEIIYFLNERFAEVLSENLIEIEHVTESIPQLSASMNRVVGTEWKFGEQTPSGAAAGLTFDGAGDYIDISSTQAATLFTPHASFEITARFQLEPEDTSRRPIVDAYRFSLEIDSENRPYLYMRQSDGAWAKIRGEPLAADQWHDLSVIYNNGKLSLTVNGDLIGARAGLPMSATYALNGPYIGKSDHLGGLFFKGQIASVSLVQLQDRQDLQPEQVQIITLDGDGPSENEEPVQEAEGESTPYVVPDADTLAVYVTNARRAARGLLENAVDQAIADYE